MILMERGKLDLYQPVAEYLPHSANKKSGATADAKRFCPENGRCWLSIFYG